MPTSDLPINFLRLNSEQTKNLAIVVEIDGVDLLTNRPIYTTLRYGDPGIFYGGAGLFYGGLRKMDGVRDILDLDKASMVIAQRLEPEQGKGAIQQIGLTFIDLDGYMTEIIARGPVIPEILGRNVRVWLGYVETSYPDDYFIVFRGVITAVDSAPGSVTLQFSDANVKRREQICFTPQVPLAGALTTTDTVIPLLSNTDFYQPILGPDGTYDVNGPWNIDGTYNVLADRSNGVRTFIQIDSEYIEYGPLGFLTVPTAEVQNIKYTSAVANQVGATISYTAGGTAGSEVVTVIGTDISVEIQSGVSTTTQIMAAVAASGPAAALVNTALLQGTIILQNVSYFFSEPQIYDAVVAYTAGAPTSTPIIGVVGNNITIQIKSGVTNANQIVTAIDSTPSITALGVSVVVFGIGTTVQTAPAGPISIGGNPQTAPDGSYLVAFGFDGVIRGARGTTAATHNVSATVQSAVEFTENAMILALKLMLSGWDGAWISDVTLFSIVETGDGVLMDQPGALILPTSIDAVRDYGLTPGDYVTISDSSIPGNNITSTVVRFGNLNGQNNRIIYLADQSLAVEFPTSGPISAVCAFRSQYDTYPVACGATLTPSDVDVAGHVLLRDDWLSDPGDSYRFFITQSIDNLKQFIETQIYLPVSTYSLTKRGQLSVKITRPPLIQGQLIVLNADNVKDPETIKISRATNNRKFFNEVDYTIDYNDSGNSANRLVYLNVNSLSQIGVSEVLPIDCEGVRTDLGSVPLLQTRANNILARYKYGAAIIELKTNWEYGVQIEAGDIIALQDDGKLQISNFDTGTRNLGTQLFEVVNRALDVKQADCALQLISGIGLSLTDRYGVVSPSSIVVDGSSSYLIIEDSFGAQYPGNEMAKWTNFQNQPIVLHDADYTVSYATVITGFDAVDNYKMTIAGFPGGEPSVFAGLIMDIPNYPQTTSKLAQSIYKAIFAYFSPTVPVVSGASETQFDVSSGDIGKFFVKGYVRLSTADYSTFSGTADFQISDITGTTITLSAALPFIPNNTFIVTSIGFPDLTGTYRYI